MDNFENIKILIYSATIHISDLHHYDRIQQNIHHMHCLTYYTSPIFWKLNDHEKFSLLFCYHLQYWS